MTAVGRLLPLALPTGVTIIGGLLAVWWQPSDRARAWLQHFAAGVVTAALALELMPALTQRRAWFWVELLCFSLGGVCMFALKWGLLRLERRETRRGLGLLVATVVDVFTDGLVIGIGLATSQKMGSALSLGLSAEMLFLGGAAASLPQKRRWSPLLVTLGLAAMLLAGAVAGLSVFAQGRGGLVAGGLAFGAAALLYLITEELLVEAHQNVRENPVGAAFLFSGFLVFWGLEVLVV